MKLQKCFLSIFQVCNDDYYKKAFQLIQFEISNPVFIIFSDDVGWATEYVKRIIPGAIVYSESGNDDVAEKIRLMSLCNHFIISNSTFSWWAQFLATGKDKIVIAPSKWRNNEYWADSPIMDERWVNYNGVCFNFRKMSRVAQI